MLVRGEGGGRKEGEGEGMLPPLHDNDDGPYSKLCITLVPAEKVAIELFSNVPIPSLTQPPARRQEISFLMEVKVISGLR